jgi:hypothetical protein
VDAHPQSQWIVGHYQTLRLQLDGDGGFYRIPNGGKGRRERIPGRAKHLARMSSNHLTQNPVMVRQPSRHLRGIGFPQPGRSFNIGQQHRHLVGSHPAILLAPKPTQAAGWSATN